MQEPDGLPANLNNFIGYFKARLFSSADCELLPSHADEEMEEEAVLVTILFQADGISKGRNNNTCEFQPGSHSQGNEVA